MLLRSLGDCERAAIPGYLRLPVAQNYLCYAIDRHKKGRYAAQLTNYSDSSILDSIWSYMAKDSEHIDGPGAEQAEPDRLKELLEGSGLAIHRGDLGFDVIAFGAMERPVVALHETTEEPAPEEVAALVELAKQLTRGSNRASAAEGYTLMMANTLTFRKRDGRWSYRGLTWKVGPTWLEADSLEAAIDRNTPDALLGDAA